MRKRSIVTLAMLPALLSPLSASFSVSSAATSTFTVKHIYYNNQLVSSPYGFVANQTTYIPIWYIMQVLERAGIQSTWKDGQWNLVVPSTYPMNWNNLSLGTGNASLSVNGRVVQKLNSVVRSDPYSGQPTTYMPIWYVMQVMNRLGMQSEWNGTAWYIHPPVVSSVSDLRVRHIDYDGKLMSSPYGFVRNNTTYMPIWYMENVFRAIGIANTFSQGQWRFTIPSYYKLDLSNLSPGRGSASIVMNGTVVMNMDSVSYEDPYAGNQTTYVPIWSVMQALNRIGLKSSWQNATDWVLTPSFTTVDLRYPAPGNITASLIDRFLQDHNSPFTGLGASYIHAQNTYGVDANYLVSHSIEECGWTGSDLSTEDNNLYGYGAYDSEPTAAGKFPSDDYAIQFEAWEVRNNYLTPGSSHYVAPTLTGMNVHYATDPNWANNIGSLMSELAAAANDSVQSYKQYNGDDAASAPAPARADEPVYVLNGAAGVVQSNATYHGLPYYSDMETGESKMFYGQTLQVGSSGTNVVALQEFLNQTIHSGLAVDGQFGNLTEQAVIRFQQQNGLTASGTWDYSLWKKYIEPSYSLIPAGTSIWVDEMKQGMSGPYVMEWYHVPGYGWVDGQYVHFTNVYRVSVANPHSSQTSVPVYDASGQQMAVLHAGDFVVANNAQATAGAVQIQFANEWTGQLLTGYIHSSDGELTQQP